jgi:hypothetical protein
LAAVAAEGIALQGRHRSLAHRSAHPSVSIFDKHMGPCALPRQPRHRYSPLGLQSCPKAIATKTESAKIFLPWVVTFNMINFSKSLLGLNLFGDGLRDALDPRLK